MLAKKNEADSFLALLDSLYPLIKKGDLKKHSRFFRTDLIAALHNQRSSLPTILNPIYKMKPKPGYGVAVAVGGSKAYVSAFRISSKGVIKFLNRKSLSLPEKTTKKDLFHLITKNVLSVTKGRKKPYPIGIGFAYPLKPVIHHRFIDGELLFMSKGREIKGLVGKKVGQEYHKFLIKEYDIDTTVAVANDAICLLLGGDGVDIAGVVGTGLNFAYWEKRSSIAPLKLGELTRFVQADIAINTESANFDKIKATNLRKIVDGKSDDPGLALSEKEAAGAYLYQIFNAGKNKILGKNFPLLSSSDQLHDIFTNVFRFPKNTSDEIRRKAKVFAERIYHRSAQIVAIQLCGILVKIGKTKGVIPVVMEGGVFWYARNYPALVNLYMNMILPEVIPSFARIFGSSRKGIAILARGN